MAAKISDELLDKVRKAVLTTGYPLELEIGSFFESRGWIPFHSVEYLDPETEKQRELDLLVYKNINKRRIELRVSTKTSMNKQFVFFTKEDHSYQWLNSLKHTPVSDRRPDSIPKPLMMLPFFSHRRDCINFTVLAGDKVDREARSILRDAMFSCINSIHHRILPHELLHDERGTVYFFLVVLRAEMFEATYDGKTKELKVDRCKYARWEGKLNIPKRYWGISVRSADGTSIPFHDVLYWFGDWIAVEFVSDSYLDRYLSDIERLFGMLGEDDLALFGKEWIPENFPKDVSDAPTFGSTKKGAKLS
jgi:hypothetical protein